MLYNLYRIVDVALLERPKSFLYESRHLFCHREISDDIRCWLECSLHNMQLKPTNAIKSQVGVHIMKKMCTS